LKNSLIALLAVTVATGCALFRSDPAPGELASSAELGPAPSSPAAVPPGVEGDSATWWEALAADERRVVVSKEAHWLWLVEGDSTLFTAPVAVERDTVIQYRGQEWGFSTPTGRLAVVGKEEQPEWVPPDWYYYELAEERGLEPVQLPADTTVYLGDYTWIHVRDGDVGRVDRFGYLHSFSPGTVLDFDGKIFIPPPKSSLRRVPVILGTQRLILGGGYLIHGTPLTDPIGQGPSHGCIRMSNRDIEMLYGMVDPGVPVYIY
jgi:lipoprotein-anchoring transpeptidase ErfK/SrfK